MDMRQHYNISQSAESAILHRHAVKHTHGRDLLPQVRERTNDFGMLVA